MVRFIPVGVKIANVPKKNVAKYPWLIFDTCNNNEVRNFNRVSFRSTFLNTMKYQGTCSCGSVTFGIDTDPLMVYHCHCSHCRQFASTNELAPYHTAAMMWRWNVHVEGEIEYVQTTALLGLFAMARGKCVKCKDPIWEKGQRAVAPYAMVMAEPLQIKADTNIFYNSGYKNGPSDMKRTLCTDFGSLIYEIYIVLVVGIPMLPVSLFQFFFGNNNFTNKAD